MKRIKTLSLTAALFALALGGTLIGATPAQAHPHPVPVAQPHQKGYYVYYRECPHSAWKFYGGYYSPATAQECVNIFRRQGYDAFYREGPVR